MRTLILFISVILASGCATSATVLCDHDSQGLTIMVTPPTDAAKLIEQIRRDYPNALDNKTEHLVWLTSESGEIFLCSYQRTPVITSKCGAYVHSSVQTQNGLSPGKVSISACH